MLKALPILGDLSLERVPFFGETERGVLVFPYGLCLGFHVLALQNWYVGESMLLENFLVSFVETATWSSKERGNARETKAFVGLEESMQQGCKALLALTKKRFSEIWLEV